jgi:xanthine dehydrogenase accessory factor
MRDILPHIERWTQDGKRFALATVVQTWGSAPRGIGSCMIVAHEADGDVDTVLVHGSVSGGCVEGAVIDAAEHVIKTGTPAMLEFGVADETAWNVGLSCGGRIRVFVEVFWGCSPHESTRELWRIVQERLHKRLPTVLITRTDTGSYSHILYDEHSRYITDTAADVSLQALSQLARTALDERRSMETELSAESFIVRLLPAPPQLVVVGAGHIAVHLVKFARELEFETTVIDPRGVFADAERFGASPPDKLLNAWPDEALPTMHVTDETCVVMLTHDPKIDDPALQFVLKRNVRYIGALGSTKTHEKRLHRLREAGFDDEALRRIHAPVGLAIGAKTPAEVALSIMAEIVKVQRRGKQDGIATMERMA